MHYWGTWVEFYKRSDSYLLLMGKEIDLTL